MKTANMRIWTAALRSTGSLQANEKLGYIKGGQKFQCCLAVGADKAGITCTTRGDGVLVYGEHMNQHVDLPPHEFRQWLGLRAGGGRDVLLDWTLNDGTFLRLRSGAAPTTAAALNDSWRFTFSQIADCIDYFGLAERL